MRPALPSGPGAGSVAEAARKCESFIKRPVWPSKPICCTTQSGACGRIVLPPTYPTCHARPMALSVQSSWKLWTWQTFLQRQEMRGWQLSKLPFPEVCDWEHDPQIGTPSNRRTFICNESNPCCLPPMGLLEQWSCSPASQGPGLASTTYTGAGSVDWTLLHYLTVVFYDVLWHLYNVSQFARRNPGPGLEAFRGKHRECVCVCVRVGNPKAWIEHRFGPVATKVTGFPFQSFMFGHWRLD